jgi:hypothetical protein
LWIISAIAAAAGFWTVLMGELETGLLDSSAGASTGRCGRLGGAGSAGGGEGMDDVAGVLVFSSVISM